MDQPLSATSRHRRSLAIVFGLTFTYLIAEVVGGIITNSLALLADAAHMFTDVGGLALALFATWVATKPATPTKTYGYYRFEILAATINGVVLFLLAFYILYEAYRRLQSPPEVTSLPMLVVAGVGLIVNLVGVWLLQRGSTESLNMQGAFLEVVSDALGSIGVIIAAVVMLTTGWYYADPLFSILIGLFILPRTWRLLSQAVNVLMEGAPEGIQLDALRALFLNTDGVEAVHDLHVWTITSGIAALSAHVVLKPQTTPAEAQAVLATLYGRVKEEFNIDHTTLQVEHTSLEDQEFRL